MYFGCLLTFLICISQSHLYEPVDRNDTEFWQMSFPDTQNDPHQAHLKHRAKEVDTTVVDCLILNLPQSAKLEEAHTTITAVKDDGSKIERVGSSNGDVESDSWLAAHI